MSVLIEAGAVSKQVVQANSGVPVVARLLQSEAGMTTAEYAVGTVAACGMGGILLKLLTSPQVTDMLWKVIEKAFAFIF